MRWVLKKCGKERLRNILRRLCIAHFAGRRFTVDHKKRERYSKEFRQQAVERMNAGDNITRLSRELGVARHLLYHWRDRLEHTHAPVGVPVNSYCASRSWLLEGQSQTRRSNWIFSDVPCKE